MAEEQELSEEDLKNMSPEEMLALQKQNCIFCKIISKEIPSNEVYSDDLVLGVLDINPAAKGHVLVMPKEHYQILPQIPPETLNALFVAAQHISQAELKGMQVEGTTVFIANGAAAGQRAPHFLFHVIPREANDGLFSSKPKEIPAPQLSELRRVLRSQLPRIMKGNILPTVQEPAVGKPMTVASNSIPDPNSDGKSDERYAQSRERIVETDSDAAMRKEEERAGREEKKAAEKQKEELRKSSERHSNADSEAAVEEAVEKEKEDFEQPEPEPESEPEQKQEPMPEHPKRPSAPLFSPRPSNPGLDAIANMFLGKRQ